MSKKTDMWMPIYIGDYLADTGHLTTTQHGAYLLLLMHYWRKLGLPDDDKQLAAIAKLPLRIWLDSKETLQAFFHEGWKHKRIESELQKRLDVSNKRAEAGARGGKSRVGQEAIASSLLKQNASMTQSHTQSKESKEESISRASALDDGWPTDYGDQFWLLYPRRTEKLAAMKKLAALRKSGVVTWADLIAGVKRYAAEKANTEQQFIKHPTVWLNKGCWTDEPATGGNYGNRTANPRQTGHDAILAAAHRKARALDRDGEMAGSTDAPGSADRDGTDHSGPSFGADPLNRIDGDYHRVEPDGERVSEGEIIPPDQNAAWFPDRGRLVS